MAFAYKRSLTIDSTKCGSSDSSSFPVLVYISSSTMKTVGNGGHIQNTVTQSGGTVVTMPADLVFTSDSGGTTKIPWEVQSYDATNGILWVWVILSTVSHSSNTVFYMFYGDATVSTQQNTSTLSPSHVWNSNFKAVYHLEESPTGSAPQFVDSTSNANNMTVGTAVFTPSQITGQIGGGVSYPSSGSNPYNGDNAFAASGAGLTGKIFTITGWYNSQLAYANNTFGDAPLFGTLTYPYGVFLSNDQYTQTVKATTYDNTNFGAIRTSGNIISSSAWHYLAMTGDGTLQHLYIDGAHVNSTTDQDGAHVGSTPFINAGNPYTGSYFDEVHINSANVGADWIITEYNNQNNPASFITVGAETPLSSGKLFRMIDLAGLGGLGQLALNPSL